LNASSKMAIIRRNGRHHLRAIVLMDCELPGMSGPEATVLVRGWRVEKSAIQLLRF